MPAGFSRNSFVENSVSSHSAISVSIVVACRNEMGHIRTFLDSVLRQQFTGQKWEVIVADGMSDDGTRDILTEYAARHSVVRVIDNPGKIVSTGLNAAIEAARGEVILRMDAHTNYASDYCLLCLETLESTGADNVGGPARTKPSGKLGRAVAAAYHSRFCTGARFHDVNYEGYVETVTYGCWRKSTFDRIGMFDETLVRNQDDELNLRLVRSGGTIWQNPRIRSWYSPRTTLAGVFRQYFQYGFWKVAVIRKHRIPGSWRHAVPVLFTVANLALLGGLLVSILAGSALWSSAFGAAWASVLLCYGTATLLASAAAATSKGWDLFPYLPAVFATYHFSWGLGFLVGIFRLLPRRERSLHLTPDSAFTKLSR
jgi:succinoglycan biosynthesis protein ExoA